MSALGAELRRSKRREEKLAALQYRLREDLKQNQGDIRWVPLQDALSLLLSRVVPIRLRRHWRDSLRRPFSGVTLHSLYQILPSGDAGEKDRDSVTFNVRQDI